MAMNKKKIIVKERLVDIGGFSYKPLTINYKLKIWTAYTV